MVALALPVIARPAADPEPAAVHLRVLIGGDLLPHRPQLVDPERIGSALSPLTPLLREADASMANYETATGDPDMFKAHARALAAPPAWAAALRTAGLSAVSVANNHACDRGKRGLAATLDATRAAGLPAVGAGDAPWAPNVIAERSGKRVCVVAWTTLSNERASGCASSGRLAFAKADARGIATAESAIAAAREVCDATIAVFHGGDEYEMQSARVMTMATAVAEAGAAAVVIHHPHVVSPMVVATTRDGRHVPIFASVGNLASNQGETWDPSLPARQGDRHVVYLNGWTRLGMLADLDFEMAPGGTVRTRFGYRLVWNDNDHASDKRNPHPRIESRLLEDEGDAAVVRKLSRDKSGPTAVFEDKCKIQSSVDRPTCE